MGVGEFDGGFEGDFWGSVGVDHLNKNDPEMPDFSGNNPLFAEEMTENAYFAKFALCFALW